VLVGGSFVPLGSHPKFWEEIVYYQPGWQIRNSYKAFLPIIFIEGHARKSNNSMMLVGFSRFFHGFDLLEGNVNVWIAPLLMN
jgi:hypothetical protein